MAKTRPGMPSLVSLHTYTSGKGVVEISSGGTLTRSTSHGAWERSGERTYVMTSVAFRYDGPTGAYLGTIKFRRTLELAPDGRSFTGVSVNETRDLAGNVIAGSNTRRDAETGERIDAEPIPAQP